MRDEEFKQKLTEVAEWEMPLTLDCATRNNELQRYLENNDLDCVNDTYPPKIVKLKIATVACEDCGKIVEGRHKEMRVLKGYGCNLVKEKCVTCGQHKDPFTKMFNVDGATSHRRCLDYIRNKLRKTKRDK